MNCMKLKNVLPLLVVLALGCRREKADVLFPEGEGSCEVAFQEIGRASFRERV